MVKTETEPKKEILREGQRDMHKEENQTVNYSHYIIWTIKDKEYEMGRACNMHGTYEKSKQVIGCSLRSENWK